MGLLQNGKIHQDIVCCSQTEACILYEKLILQQPQVIAAIPKVSCKHGLWLVARVNKNGQASGTILRTCPFFYFSPVRDRRTNALWSAASARAMSVSALPSVRRRSARILASFALAPSISPGHSQASARIVIFSGRI